MAHKLHGKNAEAFKKKLAGLSQHEREKLKDHIHHHDDGSIDILNAAVVSSVIGSSFDSDFGGGSGGGDLGGGGGDFGGGGASGDF